MTTPTSPDRSVSDDALASGGPAGDGGFNLKKPFTTRDGRLVSGIAGVLPPALSITGVVSGEEMSWDRETGKSCISRNLDLINIDVDPLAVPSNSAGGDTAGKDDAKVIKEKDKVWHPVQARYSPHSAIKEITLRAYEVYCHVHGPQPAMVDFEGRGCRGGFSAGELIACLYARSFSKEEWSGRCNEAFNGMKTK